MDADLLYEDGYPTQKALDLITEYGNYDGETALKWFALIKPLWHLSSWGWREEDDEDHWGKIRRFYLSTAGWSGNEEIIEAMKLNDWYLWNECWEQSNRGGHYIFEVRVEDE